MIASLVPTSSSGSTLSPPAPLKLATRAVRLRLHTPGEALTNDKTRFCDQQELLRWAGSIPARSELPRLIRRLVVETGRDIQVVDFPAAEGTAAGGWDGVAVAGGDAPFVPAGQSLWELSAGQSTTAKANRDYEKRTTTPDGRPTSEATYIAVSLRRWKDRRLWATERTKDNRWNRVRAYGIDDVETWLESAPITHAWFSSNLDSSRTVSRRRTLGGGHGRPALIHLS